MKQQMFLSNMSKAHQEKLAQEAFIFPEEKILLFIFSPSSSPEIVVQVELLCQNNSIFKERIMACRSFIQRHHLESMEDYLNYKSKSTADFMSVFNDALNETAKETDRENRSPLKVNSAGGYIDGNVRSAQGLVGLDQTVFKTIPVCFVINENKEVLI